MLKKSVLLLLVSAASLNAAVIEITTMEQYKALCAESKPFVLMFYAPWCGACQGMKEPFNLVSAVHGKDITLAKVNIDHAPTKSLKEAFCITSIPTFITRQAGMMSKEDLTTMVEGHIRKPVAPQASAKKVSTKKS